MATWFQGTADEFIRVNIEGWKRGVRILHFLGGTSVELEGARAVAQTKMTISQRATLHDVECDVVCTGRFYDFLEERDGRWGLVLRQPIYEKDRLDPVDPAARVSLDPEILAPLSHRLPAPRLPADADRVRRQARHAGTGRAGSRGAVPGRSLLALGRTAAEARPAGNDLADRRASTHRTSGHSNE